MSSEGFKTQAVDVEEVTEKELKFGYWYLTNKEKIKKGIMVALVVFSVVTFGYAIFGISRYYIFESEELETSMISSVFDYVNIPGVHQSSAIMALEVTTRQVLPAGDNKIDIAIKLRNPNTKWTLENVSYQISHGGKFYEAEETFILPGEEKYLMMLNVEGARSGTPQVFFSNYQWRRVTLYEEWAPQRLNFLVTNKKFVSARQGEISEQLPVSEVQADLTNASAYNYNEVEVQIALMAGSRLVGVSKIAVQNLDSGVKRPIVTRWTQSLPAVSIVEIIPSVNILDDSVYKEFEGDFDPSYLEVEKRGY